MVLFDDSKVDGGGGAARKRRERIDIKEQCSNIMHETPNPSRDREVNCEACEEARTVRRH